RQADAGPLRGRQDAPLEVEAEVADALAVKAELLVVVRDGWIAGEVWVLVARDHLERQRDARLELDRAELEAERRDQGRRDDVGDLVDVVALLELEDLVSPVGDQSERGLEVTEHLRGVDGDVAARVDRRAKRVEVDIAADLRSSRNCTGS